METASKPLKLDPGPQLLIDDYLVDDIWMIRRSPELPLKSMDNPILKPQPPFEEASHGVQTVFYDEEDKLFKMWYGITGRRSRNGGPPSSPFSTIAYAVSEDGLNWETPSLGIIEYDGSKDNNLCLGLDQGTGFVMKDEHDPDPSRRYKMLHTRQWKPGMEGRVTASFSPDGTHWTPAFEDWRKSVRPRSGDGSNITMYDPKLGKYVLFCRTGVMAAVKSLNPEEIGFPPDRVRKDDLVNPEQGFSSPKKENMGFPSEDDFVMHREAEDYIHRYLKVPKYVHTRALRLYAWSGVGCNRRIARAESDDFLHWTLPETVIRPDELDPPKFYNIKAGMYHRMYFGTLQVFQAWNYSRFPGDPLQEPEVTDIQLTFSRDGKKWDRLANRPNFIPRGIMGAFDGGLIMTSAPPLVESEDHIFIFYTGSQFSHLVAGGERAIGVARLPKERLVARVAGDELGVLITKPFILDGERLEVNVDARGYKSHPGQMKVEVTDIMGDGLPGFTVGEAEEIRESGFRLPVRWKDGDNLGNLKGKTVRLRFYMRETRLYSFCFSGGK